MYAVTPVRLAAMGEGAGLQARAASHEFANSRTCGRDIARRIQSLKHLHRILSYDSISAAVISTGAVRIHADADLENDSLAHGKLAVKHRKSMGHVGMLFLIGSSSLVYAARAADERPTASVTVDWQQVVRTSKTNLTIQVCPEPPMRRGGPIHRQAHAALRDLRMSYARLQPWFPYPKLSIAELEPPQDGRTSWDFSLIDPIVLDFYAAAQGRPIVLNLAVPDWLFKGPRHQYPQDPNEIDWAYELRPRADTAFRDPTLEEAAEYFSRVAQWYIKGGFTDEYGKRHESGHHLKIDYWEVLNEPDEDLSHLPDPRTYTAFYDTLVSRLRALDPGMKFSGLALANGNRSFAYLEYFLDRKNHQPGIPLDMVSYHTYIVAKAGAPLPERQEKMFAQVDQFLITVRKIEELRNRIAPATQTSIGEFGVMWGESYADLLTAIAGKQVSPEDSKIPQDFWTLSGSVYAYGFLGVIRAGVNMVAAAELVDYPTQLAGTNLIDWNTGQPNAAYRVVKLLRDELLPGARLLRTTVVGSGLDAQAFETPRGRRLLLINKTMNPLRAHLQGAWQAQAAVIDRATGSGPPRHVRLMKEELELQPMATAIVSLRD
jgi:hypothetical protein